MSAQFAARLVAAALAGLAGTAQANVAPATAAEVQAEQTEQAEKAAQAEQEAYYAGLDQQIAARDGRRRWAPPMDLGHAARAAWPGAQVGHAACGTTACRVHVAYSGPNTMNDEVEAFVRRLSDLQDSAGTPQSTAGIALRYHPARPQEVTVYLLAPTGAQRAGGLSTQPN